MLAFCASLLMFHCLLFSIKIPHDTHTARVYGWNSMFFSHFNPNALRKAKIVYNFGVSECNKVNKIFFFF